ncbi:hypothetical protein AUK10_04195 [Candidatus Gracilibacteria bacterium CG2_30_37_12]|nr:MAG: hypothetical protein AUK10_04195 [Candidatus Gracilibacteria bacterium CG2_30_37_12]
MSLYIILFGMSYVLLAVGLFFLNLYLFEKITPFDVRNEIFKTQKKALGYIIRGQLLGQGIMMGMLIYFLGVAYDYVFSLDKYITSLVDIIVFGLTGIVLFQLSLYIFSKVMPFEKEIITENNESLGIIIEGFLIAMAIIISVSLYSY